MNATSDSMIMTGCYSYLYKILGIFSSLDNDKMLEEWEAIGIGWFCALFDL
jgi:hypothetical protein